MCGLLRPLGWRRTKQKSIVQIQRFRQLFFAKDSAKKQKQATQVHYIHEELGENQLRLDDIAQTH